MPEVPALSGHGGVAVAEPLLTQLCADVTNLPQSGRFCPIVNLCLTVGKIAAILLTLEQQHSG